MSEYQRQYLFCELIMSSELLVRLVGVGMTIAILVLVCEVLDYAYEILFSDDEEED